MKKNLINEVSRIQQIMGKSIISEQATALKVLKNIFTDFSDDALRKIFKTFDSDIDNAVNAIKRGDTVSDDIIVKLIKNLDFESISKIIFDNKLLGTQFDSNIDEAILFLKNNPKNYDSVIEQFNNTVDKLTYLRGAPPELVQSLKNELKNIIDDGLRTSSKITDSTLDDALRNIFDQNMESIINGTKSVDDVLNEFLQANGTALSKFYNPKEIKLYIEQMTGALRQGLEKSTQIDAVYADLSKVWDKMTLTQKRDFAKKSIEGITKKIPFGYKDLFNVQKLTEYIIKGADNEFSLELFWKRIRNLWSWSVAIQAVVILYNATNLTAQQKKGYELTWQEKVNAILNGRSIEEFVFNLLVPPISWLSNLISLTDRDAQFDELKSQLPVTIRDNVFRNESGEGYYIKQAGVVYPLELHNNQWEVQIDGSWYKLSDVEGF
jgi:hypothetical protein